MLHNLRLRNFRAFRNQQFEFARINIFVGKNSSGKSSALSAINFLAQSLSPPTSASTPIIFNGPFEQLGTFIDIVHGNHVLTPIEFDLTYGTSTKHRITFSIKYRPQRRETEIASFSFQEQTNQIPLYEYYTSRKGYDIRVDGQLFEQLFPNTQKTRPIFNSMFPHDCHVMRFYPSVADEKEYARLGKEKFDFLQNIERRIRRGRNELNFLFRNFDSLNPFRDQPQRTYLFTGEVPSTVGKTGTNGIAMLASDYSRRGGAKTGIIEEISKCTG